MKKLTDFNSVHFIGILGSSMSNLALSTKQIGLNVSGSDIRYDNLMAVLKQNGIYSYIGTKPEIVEKSDLVVYTSAISPFDTELSHARKLGKLCLSRAEYLAFFCKSFKRLIAISGTHGKSTVTAMTGAIFESAGLSPFVHIGAKYETQNKFNFDYAIVEACEYKKSFLTLSPDIGVILNVESDHPDYYKSLSELYSAFYEFAGRINSLGLFVINENVNVTSNAKTFKLGRDAYAVKINHFDGYFSFTPYILGKKYPNLSLSIRGEHNVHNALFALLISALEKIPPSVAVASLSSFSGVDRRYQKVDKINGAEIILDYAHHPTEIEASINTAKLYSSSVTVYFQPHTYSRTEKLFPFFLTAFDKADKVVIVEEYPARETPDMGKSAKDLANALSRRKNCIYASLEKAKELLHTTAYFGETILILGAGNINSIL